MHGLQYRMYFMVMSGLHAWFIVQNVLYSDERFTCMVYSIECTLW